MSSPEKHDEMSFEELKQSTDAEILARVPKASAMQICEQSLEYGECSVSEVLHLWAEKLLKVYGAVRVPKNDWLILVGFLERIFQRMILLEDAELNVISNSWSSACLEFLRQINADEDFSFTELSMVVRFMLFTVKAYFDLNKRGAPLGRAALKYALSVPWPVLELLSKRIDGSRIEGVVEIFSLIEIIRSLCEVYTCVSGLFVDMRTMVAIWKYLAKLVVYCHRNIRSVKFNTEVDAAGAIKTVSNWARTPVTLLLMEVNKQISIIYKESTLNQPFEQIEKYLRVTSFYLKLLLQVASDFQHAEFPAIEELFEQLCQAIRVPRFLAEAKVYTLVEKHIQNGFSDILMVLYKNHDMQQMLLRCLEKCEWDWWNLVKLYLHASVLAQDSDFIDRNAAFFIKLFERVLEGKHLFVCADRFDMVIDNYAALTILNSTSELRSYFKEMILSPENCLAQAGVEVLLVAARHRKRPDEDAHEFRFWHQHNDRFALLSNNLKRLNVRRLLRCYFELSNVCSETSKNRLTDSFADQHQLAFCSEITLLSSSTRLNAELLTLLIGCETGSNIDSYYKMVLYMILLNSPKIKVKTDLICKMAELLLSICCLRTQERRQRFHAFVCAAFHFLSGAGNIDTVECIVQNIFSCLNDDAPNNSKLWLTALCYFANVCCLTANLKLQAAAKSIIVKLENTRVYSIIGVIYFSRQCNNYRRSTANNKLYQSIKRRNSNGRSCSESCCTMAVQPCKRLRLQCKNEKVKQLLQNTLNLSAKVSQISGQWDKEDILTLKSIAHNISNAMQEK